MDDGKRIWTPHNSVIPKKIKRTVVPEPVVPDTVKQWGALAGWLRRKYTPMQVRQIVEAWEKMELPLEETEGTVAPKELKTKEVDNNGKNH